MKISYVVYLYTEGRHLGFDQRHALFSNPHLTRERKPPSGFRLREKKKPTLTY